MLPTSAVRKHDILRSSNENNNVVHTSKANKQPMQSEWSVIRANLLFLA
jgi:hypothetical protein